MEPATRQYHLLLPAHLRALLSEMHALHVRFRCLPLLLRVPFRARAAAAGTVILLTATACTSAVSTGAIQSPPAPPSCSSQPAESLLRSFVRVFDAGRSNLVAPYFAEPPRFMRWADPTINGSYIGSADYSKLAEHLSDLQHHGIRLRLLSFKGSSMAGVDSAGFEFKVARSSKIPDVQYDGKGYFDCISRRISVVVIDKW